MSQFVHKARYILLLVPCLFIFFLYAPALHYGRIWDDWALLGNFGAYKDPSLWKYVLSSPLPFSDNYFRPLVVFTFVLQGYAGLGDLASHLVNILIHCTNSLLVMVLALRLWPSDRPVVQRRLAALAIGILYAVHPAMTEGTVWIVGRFDLMVTFFMLLSILADTSIRSTYLKTFCVGLLFLCGLLCKEMAITLPVLLVIMHAARTDEKGYRFLFARDRLAVYAGLTAGLAIYLLMRYLSLGYLMRPELEIPFLDLGSPMQHLLLTGATFARYLVIMVLPFLYISPLHYAELPIASTDITGWLGLVALFALVAICAVFVRRASTRFPALCLGAMGIMLLPVLHISPVPMLLANTIVADRVLMAPLAFFLLGMGELMSRTGTRKAFSFASAGSAAWVILAILIVRVNVPLWSSDFLLWQWLSIENPKCSYCLANHARLLSFNGRPEAAVAEADRAYALAAQPWQAAMALGAKSVALYKAGRMDDAINAAAKAAEAEPVPRNKIGYELQQASLLIKARRVDEAYRVFEHIVSMGGGERLDTFVEFGDLALATNRPDLARKFYADGYLFAPRKLSEARFAKTNDPEKWQRLGDMLKKKHDDSGAAKAYEEADRLRKMGSSAVKETSPL